MKARIVIGANYGDEGKGTVVAHYTKHSEGDVLNVLTNGGAQRGHSILTEDGSMTFQHFGSGTYHGADNYYSRYFILNPMQFVREYETLVVKPYSIWRDPKCRWTTPYDSMANLISERLQGRHASCCMGIWNTVRRYNSCLVDNMTFDEFILGSLTEQYEYLDKVKAFFEKEMVIPDDMKAFWDSTGMKNHFIQDCKFMYSKTKVLNQDISWFYDELIFENGQGLLLCDKGVDSYDATPSNTGIKYAMDILKEMKGEFDITAHYVTRPYLTRHGDGGMEQQSNRKYISEGVNEDRTNHFNDFQGEFRYGLLDMDNLKKRINEDNKDNVKVELEVTHCDEMDRVSEFKKLFGTVNTYDSALIK